ncbi:MAG: hypothetical protein ACI9QD_000362 [Thermoproteota archaeon]|jgi:hypothetical protein
MSLVTEKEKTDELLLTNIIGKTNTQFEADYGGTTK